MERSLQSTSEGLNRMGDLRDTRFASMSTCLSSEASDVSTEQSYYHQFLSRKQHNRDLEWIVKMI